MKLKPSQTGLPVGSFRHGDEHPSVEGFVFRGYGKRRSGKMGEDWLTKEKFRERMDKRNASSRTPEARKRRNASQKRRYAENPEKHRQFTKNWANRNRERIAKYAAEYRLNNRDRFAANEARRRSKLRSNTPSGDHANLINQFYTCASRLTDCTKFKWSVDHIIPVARGGLHAPSNLQVVPMRWNQVKKDTNTNRISIL